MSKRLQDKVALVTGASRGIGAAVARAYAREGAHVILVARTQGGLEAVDDLIRRDGGSATLVPLDVKDGAGIDRLGGAIHERWGKLDILVGNAGILGPITPVGHIKPTALDDLLAVNVTANWRLIRSFEPLLRASDAGRAIFVTSGAAQRHTPYWGGYAMTKAALESLVLTFAAECAKSPLRVNLVSPGAIRTAMRAKSMPGEDPTTLPPSDAVAPLFLELADANCTRHGEIVKYREWATV
ncbi:SDR family NAD(P)-dependent oxidoreductase [Govanella unica]|uniref:SDR family NAD(P)-dependent oxidoreductase n=1 Tax=Govanella unica TaxID=2975056 RepID=A0A9X3TZJ6_9PROT|nr:SDR family NAD(P)-dependent oxidoreductase [Govania unica]MDA5194334.1 SDR family NAD(P)-dependent oxidoreductase [Govania unica]